MLYNLELLPKRLQNKIEVVGECWLWTGSTTGNYGQAWWGDRKYVVHRLLFLLFGGFIPDGYTIDHRYPDCKNKLCCYPGHLDAITCGDNIRRFHALITHCPQGHSYSGDNLYIHPRGTKICRYCLKVASLRYTRKHKPWYKPHVYPNGLTKDQEYGLI